MKYLFLISAIALLGCNTNRTPKDAKIIEYGSKQSNSPQSVGHSENAHQFSAANFTIDIPTAWVEEKPSNNMRITQYRLKEHPGYEVVVSYFGNFDNMVEANINRWKEQFAAIDTYEEPALNTMGVTLVKIIGTIKLKPNPMADDFTETPGYGTLAAIVTSNEGPYFLRLNAPGEVINLQEKIFTEVLNSYRTN
jgi:hypothetical protein